MISLFLKKLFGSANDRMVKKYHRTVDQINKKEAHYQALTDDELKHQTVLFRERLGAGEKLDNLLVEAFAVVREASKRVFGMRPFDVQLIGGVVLHQGMIAEMKTGEGKTLTATLPVYLNALTGKGVHVVTVNDYLAKRDAETMGQLYEFLGLTVGCIIHGLTDSQRKEQYACDVVYGTNHEFGFDYLRDNMKFNLEEMVMRPFNYAIVDEVDSILVDEARTPLIISGPAEDSSDLYRLVNQIILLLQEGDWEIDIKQKNVTLTDQGVERIEAMLAQIGTPGGSGLYDLQNIALVHHVMAALKAHKIFHRDVDYIVKDGKVIIIDEFTGRMMDGRRYSEGLHQALEAKEEVEIEMENQTLASITYQNFFRLYPKLSGMTGTAATEATEFDEIYKLRVVSIPTNVSVIRKDYDDEVYLTNNEKYKAVVGVIKECQARHQPVLVGTTSIERSEVLSELLKQERIPHQVLNARYHEQEASIIAEAGALDAVTIATNMAGRGTDIKLGGNLEARLKAISDSPSEIPASLHDKIKSDIERDAQRVREAGGLYVIGTERHESRRIDNQLRGRSGRQGDPGASKFFVSLEDDLMKRFGSDRLDAMLRRFGAKEGEVISHSVINKALERAQKKVEAHNFEIRKHLLKYDDVMNDQRKIIYEQRWYLMNSDDIADFMEESYQDVILSIITQHVPENTLPEQWDLDGLQLNCHRIFAIDLPLAEWSQEAGISHHHLAERISQAVKEKMKAREEEVGAESLRYAEKTTLLRLLDQHWKDHLLTLDHLRQGINLRAYAQSNPLNEYKREAFNLFEELLYKVKVDFISFMAHYKAFSHEDFSSFLNEHLGEIEEEDHILSNEEDQFFHSTNEGQVSDFQEEKEDYPFVFRFTGVPETLPEEDSQGGEAKKSNNMQRKPVRKKTVKKPVEEKKEKILDRSQKPAHGHLKKKGRFEKQEDLKEKEEKNKNIARPGKKDIKKQSPASQPQVKQQKGIDKVAFLNTTTSKTEGEASSKSSGSEKVGLEKKEKVLAKKEKEKTPRVKKTVTPQKTLAHSKKKESLLQSPKKAPIKKPRKKEITED